MDTGHWKDSISCNHRLLQSNQLEVPRCTPFSHMYCDCNHVLCGTPHHTTSHHTTTMPHLATLTTPYLTTPHHTSPHHTLHHTTLTHHTLPHHTTLHHTTHHHTTLHTPYLPHHTSPHHTSPHHTTLLLTKAPSCLLHAMPSVLSLLAHLQCVCRHLSVVWWLLCACRVKKLGYPVPVFDFRLLGVTSMSADIHKYGLGIKVQGVT